MNFLEEIKQVALKTAPKWKILTEDFKTEMLEMQKYQIPISDQITLIVKHTGIEKMTESELRLIIKKYFKTPTIAVKNNSNTNNINTSNEVTSKPIVQNENQIKKTYVPTPPPKRAGDLLCTDYNLLEFPKKPKTN